MIKLDISVIYITATFLVFSCLSKVAQINCDSQESDPSQDDTLNHQLADPEYLRRELKDIFRMRIDADKDGYVSYEEMKKYLGTLHDRNIEYNVDKQWLIYSPQIHEVFSWEGYEPEKKEILTWDHYFNQTYPELVGVEIGIPINREQDTTRLSVTPEHLEEAKKREEESTSTAQSELSSEDEHLEGLKLMVRRADARWKLADENGDTLLTKDEFKFLLHPDEGHEGLKNLFVSEATEDMDLNKDGKICLDEFMKHLQVLASEQERSDPGWLSSQQENFGRFLDKNKDGILDSEEITNWLVPSRSKKFDIEAKRLMDIGDANDDSRLSISEFMENFEQYISLLPPEYWRTESVSADKSGPSVHEEL